MNIINKISLSLAIVFGLFACNKYEYQAPVESFQVLETSYDASYKASEGFVKVTEADFEVSVDAEWLKAELKEATLVKLQLSENTSSYTRTANLILKKGEQIQSVPISQFGVVNEIADFENQKTGSPESSFEFPAQFVSPVNVMITDKDGNPVDWLTYEIADGKLILKNTALPKELSSREAFVNIKAGLLDKTISITQVFTPAYEDVIGTYTLDYYAGASWSKDFPGVDPAAVQRSQAEVTIKEKEKGKTFLLEGLAYPVLLTWDAKDASIAIAPKEVEIVKDKQYLVMSISGNGYKKVEDGKPDWDFYGGSVMKGFWKDGTSNANLRFDFPPCKGINGKGELKTAEVHGLLFWIWEGGFKGRYDGNDGKGIGVLSDFFLVKKS